MSERTLVGLPLYEKESKEGIEITLGNIDDRLNELDIDSSVVIQLNGPETAAGNAPELTIDHSKYNAEIEVIQSERLGQTRALNDLISNAAAREIERAFMTDADIYRFPGSMKAMWEQGDRPVVGARYRPYPIEIVEAEFGELALEERLLYQIFDGDQSPEVRKVLRQNGLDRTDWVKASLMLLEIDTVHGMHGNQHHVTDSVMNRTMGLERSKIAGSAYFMHMGRVDMGDHIKARLRHFRGAAANNDLDNFLHKEILLPSEDAMNDIAQQIRESTPDGDLFAMLYLSRCAIRERVNQICFDIATNEWNINNLGEVNPTSMRDVRTFQDAKLAISRFFVDVDWDDVTGFAVGPPPVTQEHLRRPFNFERHLQDRKLAQSVMRTLGVEVLP